MEKISFGVSMMFGDHMVLQRDKEIVIWGQGPEDKKVCVKLGDRQGEGQILQGKWEVCLAPIPAGGPYTMEIRCEEESITFKDVYMGDVWLAGGQSNMELELKDCDDGLEEVAKANNPQIRFYNVVKTGVITPEVLEQQKASGWKVCEPNKMADVSAVAYFCAKHLQEELQIPIGVIDCYIGGTSATGWMDQQTLMSTPETKQYVDSYDELIAGKTDEQYQEEMAEYNRQYNAWNDAVLAEKAKNPDVTWEYLNEYVGLCPWPQPAGRTSNFRPGNPYQGMLTRVMPYTLKGFWYYQGEEDTYRAKDYFVLMEQLIRCWRRGFRDEQLPFVLNQLPMYIANHVEDDQTWAVLREQQRLAAKNIEHTYMSVLIDCGEFDNIHPTDKQTVGWRMALQCLAHVYGIECDADSPECIEARLEEEQIVLSFTGSGLICQGEEVALLEIADDHGIFIEKKGRVLGENVVIYKSKQECPKQVRYAWTNFGEVNLYGENGLPVAPFIINL